MINTGNVSFHWDPMLIWTGMLAIRLRGKQEKWFPSTVNSLPMTRKVVADVRAAVGMPVGSLLDRHTGRSIDPRPGPRDWGSALRGAPLSGESSRGRRVTVPAADVAGIGPFASATGDLSVGYYANDMTASEAQGGQTAMFALDPRPGHRPVPEHRPRLRRQGESVRIPKRPNYWI